MSLGSKKRKEHYVISGDLHKIRMLSADEYNELFNERMRKVLDGGSSKLITLPKQEKKKRKKNKFLHRKKRKLMPHDWAFICREYGIKGRNPTEVQEPVISGKREVQVGSKTHRLQALQDKYGLTYSDEKAVMHMNALYEKALMQNEQNQHRKYNSNVRKAQKIIDRIKSRNKKTPTEIRKEENEKTIFKQIDSVIYEEIDAGRMNEIMILQNEESDEKFQPYFNGEKDRIGIIPKHDHYSPLLIFEISGVTREFYQTNSSSAWFYKVALGKKIREEERYEFVISDYGEVDLHEGT